MLNNLLISKSSNSSKSNSAKVTSYDIINNTHYITVSDNKNTLHIELSKNNNLSYNYNVIINNNRYIQGNSDNINWLKVEPSNQLAYTYRYNKNVDNITNLYNIAFNIYLSKSLH
jgi:hypothetical protein